MASLPLSSNNAKYSSQHSQSVDSMAIAMAESNPEDFNVDAEREELTLIHSEIKETCADLEHDDECNVAVSTSEPNNAVLDKVNNGRAHDMEEHSQSCDPWFGWAIVAASFFNCFIVGLMFIAFSMLYIAFDEYFGTTKAVSGLIGSLFLATGNICGLLFSVFINRYGCRIVAIVGGLTWFVGFATSSSASHIIVLYFTYGIIAGMGFNMVTLTSFVIIQQHFKVHRAAAAAIAASGISFGSLTSGPLLGALLDMYGWRGTLLLMSAIALHSCLFGAFYRPADLTQQQQQLSSVNRVKNLKSLGSMLYQLVRDMANLSLFANLAFTLVCFGSFFMNIGLTAFFQHTPSRAKFLGIEQYSLLPMINGIATLVARLFGGFIGNFTCTNRLLQYGICIVLAGILFGILGSVETFIPIAAFGAAVAFSIGCFLTIQSTVLSDVVGVANISRAQAFVLLFCGVGSLVAIPLAGFIFDRTENYSVPFYAGGAVMTFGGVLVLLATVIVNKRRVVSTPSQS